MTDFIDRAFYNQLSILKSPAVNRGIKDQHEQVIVDYISSCVLNPAGREGLFAHLQLPNRVLDYQQLKFWGVTRS